MHLPSILAEKRLIPDSLIRIGIRQQLKKHSKHLQNESKSTEDWIKSLSNSPIAEATEISKIQHYEIPTDYFKYSLGPQLKYSSCYWETPHSTLPEAEESMLMKSAKHAKLYNGQSILELGCGWGSFSLWMAEHYPESNITCMSHSKTQKEFIDSVVKRRNLKNITVITCDINEFQTEKKYDRIVSIEMFEHLRNHSKLFLRLSKWLQEDGLIFVHIFAHKNANYLFQVEHERDWMAQYFFTGGMMPSVELLPKSAHDFNLENTWLINGNHYSKTLEAWLRIQDSNEPIILEIFKKAYGKDAKLWLQRWRIFYLACSELFSFNNGSEWFVMHYLFSKK